MDVERSRWRGRVRVVVYRPETGEARVDETFNTLTNYWRSAVAQWVTGTPASSLPLPNYIALGNGSPPTGSNGPAPTDVAGWAEIANTRKPCSSRGQTLNYFAQYIGQYLPTDPVGPYTEAMLFDSAPATTTLSTSVAQGATSLPLSAGAPAVNAGQFQAYISDGANSEYVTIAQTYAAGATSWALTSGLQYAHNAGVTVIYFNGNLFAHVQLTNVNKDNTEAMTIQWMIEND